MHITVRRNSRFCGKARENYENAVNGAEIVRQKDLQNMHITVWKNSRILREGCEKAAENCGNAVNDAEMVRQKDVLNMHITVREIPECY